MQLSHAILADMAARASTLDERLQNGYLITDPEQREHDIDRRLARWQQCAAKGDAHFFEKLLDARGLDTNSARRGLAAVKISSPQLPAWTGLIAECVAAANAADVSGSEIYRFLDPGQPVPFEQILAPFVEVGARRLRSRAGTNYALLESKAHSLLERTLLLWLAGPFSSALREFSPEVDAQFVRVMLRDKLPSFLRHYSVLARIAATLLEHWAGAISEFLERLERDLDQLASIFHDGRAPGTVVDLKAGLSDPHQGGRTVLALKFASGLKVMYKPKKLDPEFGFNKLVDWLNGRGLELKLRAPKVVLRAEYGWVEYIDYAPCLTESELERFYRRGGMLLALFHLLESTDMHAENLIASGEFPVLVDGEALITSEVRPSSSPEAPIRSEQRVARHLQNSVLKTGMLPNWRYDSLGSDYDLSGLGGVGGEEVDAVQWVAIHGGSTAPPAGKVKIQRGRNVPFALDQNAEPERFLESIVGGFEDVYRVLTEQRQSLLEAGSPLEALTGAPMRLVFRETQTYYKILKKSLEPGLLRDGADRSVELEVLSRILCASESATRSLPLVESEKRSIEQLDIPVFHSLPAARELLAGGRSIAEHYFRESAYERVIANINGLSPERCAEQCAIIRGCFYAKTLNQRAHSVTGNAAMAAETPWAEMDSNAGNLLAAAAQIAETLRRHAVWGNEDDASWFGIFYNQKSRSYRYGPLPEDLREGQAGIALFLAALAQVTKRADVRRLATAATVPLKRLVAFASDDTGWKKVNDGKRQAANLTDSLVRLAQLLHDDSLLESARDAARLATPSCRDHPSQQPPATSQLLPAGFAADSSLEESLSELLPVDSLSDGNFGLIAQAIEAAGCLGRPDLLAKARQFSSAAVDRARVSKGYRLFEALPAGVPCFGFQRGLAGIGYTLLRAHGAEIPGVFL